MIFPPASKIDGLLGKKIVGPTSLFYLPRNHFSHFVSNSVD
jgi:hypothetical protein